MNADQWTEFRRLFPSAAAWMDARDLENEYANLKSERERMHADPLRTRGDIRRLTRIDARLAELETYFANITDPITAKRDREEQ